MEYVEKLNCSGGSVEELKINPKQLKNFAYTLIVEKVGGTNPTGTIEISRSLFGCDNFVTVFDDDGTTPNIITLGVAAIYEKNIDPVVDAGAIERVKLVFNIVGGLVNVRLIAT